MKKPTDKPKPKTEILSTWITRGPIAGGEDLPPVGVPKLSVR